MTRSEAAALCLLNAAREVECYGPGAHAGIANEDVALVFEVAAEVAGRLREQAEAHLEAEPVQLELVGLFAGEGR